MSNPIMNFNEKRAEQEIVVNADSIMSINGTIHILAILGLMVLFSGWFVFNKFLLGYTDIAYMLTSVGAIAGFITALIICFARTTFLIPVYAVLEGFFVGGISAIFESSYPGIVVQAVAGTFASLFSMLLLYKAGIIKCSDKFRSVIFISTASIAVLYLVNFIGHFFNLSIPFISSSSNFGILFSVIVVIIASLNFIIDFDFIETGVQRMFPKKYEWFGAFGLLVTIVWLYVEILRLLAKLNSRD